MIDTETKSKAEKNSFWYSLLTAGKLVIKVNPIFFSAMIVASLIQAFFAFFQIRVNGGLFDIVVNAISQSESDAVKKIIGMILVVIAVQLFAIISNTFSNYLTSSYLRQSEGYLKNKLIQKAQKLSPIEYEYAETLDSINKADQGITNITYVYTNLNSILFFYIPYFGFLGAYLYQLKPILLVSILLIFIPSLFSQFIRGSVFSKLEDNSAPLRRRFDYYQDAICGRESFKETRSLGAFFVLREKMFDSLNQLKKILWKAELKTGSLEVLMRIVTLIGYGGILLMLVYFVFTGDVSVGIFAAIFASLQDVFHTMDEVICMHVSEITEGFATVRNFVHFLSLPEQSENKNSVCSKESGIVADNISFTYPSAKNSIIHNLSLKINPGEIVAIVGENGAGKSTLVKLLTGLYYPDNGSVSIGNVDTKNVSSSALFENISGVFQDYGRYKMSLKENIQISDIAAQHKESDVNDALKKADLNLDDRSFENGLNTLLSKEFGGIDLSGGQWQRVAIARGLYRIHNIIILDEPTSSIDPIEESAIYTKFREISQNKTAIIVTHRLGCAQIADKIIVLDKGQIIESGSHEELLKNHGKYTEMWDAQAQYYVQENIANA